MHAQSTSSKTTLNQNLHTQPTCNWMENVKKTKNILLENPTKKKKKQEKTNNEKLNK